MNHYTIKLAQLLVFFAILLMFYIFYSKHFVTTTINLVSAIFFTTGPFMDFREHHG